jgi:hypothetical protein
MTEEEGACNESSCQSKQQKSTSRAHLSLLLPRRPVLAPQRRLAVHQPDDKKTSLSIQLQQCRALLSASLRLCLEAVRTYIHPLRSTQRQSSWKNRCSSKTYTRVPGPWRKPSSLRAASRSNRSTSRPSRFITSPPLADARQESRALANFVGLSATSDSGSGSPSSLVERRECWGWCLGGAVVLLLDQLGPCPLPKPSGRGSNVAQNGSRAT